MADFPFDCPAVHLLKNFGDLGKNDGTEFSDCEPTWQEEERRRIVASSESKGVNSSARKSNSL